jgi:hypothetical protein
MQDKLELLQQLKASRLNKENEFTARVNQQVGWEAVQKYSKNIQTGVSNGILYDKNVQTFAPTFESQMQTDDVLDLNQTAKENVETAQNDETAENEIKVFDQKEFDQFLQQKYDLICEILSQETPFNDVQDSKVQTWMVSKDYWLTDLCVLGDAIVASFEVLQGDKDDGGVIMWKKGDCLVKRVLKAQVSLKI